MICLLYQTIGVIFTFLVAFQVLVLYQNRRQKIDLPGPRGWPLIGLGLDLPRRPRNMLNEYRKQYGDMFQMRLGWYDWVLFNNPRDVKEVFDRKVSNPHISEMAIF
jgi:cytochrome P450